MFRFDGTAVARLSSEIAERLDETGCTIAYGSLAAGADILVAEAMLARGGELHLVVPFPEADFLEQSVLPWGAQWRPRFDTCRAAASSAAMASEATFVGDEGQFAYGSMLAMGLARLRARHLEAEAVQLALWDGLLSGGVAGTGADVERWRATGSRTVAIEPGKIERRPAEPPPQPLRAEERRAIRAIIFTDYAGFSKLGEDGLPVFWHEVLGRAAAVLDRYGSAVCSRNSWGDAVFAVVTDAAAGASIALDLQQELAALRDPRLGEHGAMRIGVHYGPVFEAIDPITRAPTFFGTEVTRTARIEPVTPPGAVYATQPLAAILEMEAPGAFSFTYSGRVALAKGYGELPMYRLARGEASER
jgi:class 3 adenylate cyclase